MRHPALTTTVLCLAAAIGLTACGSSEAKPKAPFADDSGPEIVDKAIKATTGASSLTVKGDVTDPEMGALTLDLAVDTKGECTGSLSVAGEGTAELTKTGDTLYMKFDEKFLRAQGKDDPKEETDATVNMIGNRWLKMDASGEDAKDMTGLCDLDELLGEFKDVKSPARKGKTTTVDGQEAITLTEQDGKDRYELLVATKGKPYLLKVTSKGGDEPGTLNFSDYEKPVNAKAPADKDIVDLDELEGTDGADGAES
ncbi:hypothetical protein [Streptomyces apocyni]|uniref:hypothetical protein n=1 Tax=Streptomyces apocyni TaxID=2654677 RepID=UPI0012EADCEB|nr:hypothetical protein [Streptomyces apocyni]